MTITAISVQSALSQMHSLASQAASRPTSTAAVGQSSGLEPTGFAKAMSAAMKEVSGAQKAGEAGAKDFQLGKPGVSLNDVMIDMQKASIGFQSVVQVRNKMVAAYQTIASMPI